MVTQEKVAFILQKHGFSFKAVKSPDYFVLYHRGEVVGTLYDNDLYLAKQYPSLNVEGNYYADAPKDKIEFNIASEHRIIQAIEYLFDSPRRVPEERRQQRVENLRKYFSKKREEASLSDLLKRGDELERTL